MAQTEKIGTHATAISASHVLEEVDPIAYRCGLNDYVDGLDITDMQEYQDIAEAEGEL